MDNTLPRAATEAGRRTSSSSDQTGSHIPPLIRGGAHTYYEMKVKPRAIELMFRDRMRRILDKRKKRKEKDYLAMNAILDQQIWEEEHDWKKYLEQCWQETEMWELHDGVRNTRSYYSDEAGKVLH